MAINGPLNVVWLFVVPSKCLNRALNGSSFWCKEQPIVWRFFFSKSVTSPPSQPVFVFVLSTRTALIVYQLHQYQEEPCESNIYSHLVSPLWLSSGIQVLWLFSEFYFHYPPLIPCSVVCLFPPINSYTKKILHIMLFIGICFHFRLCSILHLSI